MQDLLKPIHTASLKDVFIKRFEELILSGKFPVGQKLPSERELALQLGVSRPIVHEGLVDLAQAGVVGLFLLSFSFGLSLSFGEPQDAVNAYRRRLRDLHRGPRQHR